MQIQSIIQQLSVQPNSVPDFILQKYVRKYKGLIYIGSLTDLRERVFSVFHESSLGGHSSIQAILKKLGAYFTWSNIVEDIKTCVKECDISRGHKTESVLYSGLLQPLHIPSKPWTDISVDLLKSYPFLREKLSYWLWWTDSLNFLTLLASNIHTLQLPQQKYSSTTYKSYMDYLRVLLLTETRYLLAPFGKLCLNCQECNCALTQLIIRNLMAKLRD